MATPFFEADGGQFRPSDVCRGPWDPNTLHGRVVAGLLAREMEGCAGGEAFLPSRLTVDLFRVLPFAPVRTQARMVREGNRIRVAEAELFSGDTVVARASVVFLRRSENPEGTVWSPTGWRVPAPASLPPPPDRGEREPMWETRVIDHGFGSVEQKRAWLRENRALVAGEELSPFVRVAFASDFSNPFANSGSAGLNFVNADITLYLHRLPAGEWLGFEVLSHHASEGVAVGACTIYDEQGAIGSSTVCGLANRHRR